MSKQKNENGGSKGTPDQIPDILHPMEMLAPSWLAAIVESADDGIISKTLQGIITSWNNGAQRIFGYTAEEIIGKPVLTLIPPELQHEEEIILSKLRRGERIEHYETIRMTKDGRHLNVSLTVSPIKAPDGTPIGASKIVRDITESKRAERRLKEQAEALATINRLGRLLSAELDQQKLIQSVTDAATELTGAQFGAFFYNVINRDGESYMLYTLSGVPKESFADFPMPHATAMFGPTFRGEDTIMLDNVRNDPRFGKSPPYYGLPPGHLPVTSYLAVPVISRNGEVLGGMFFGHEKEGVFSERHKLIVEGVAAQTAIAMDNARLYEKAQLAIKEREDLLVREQRARSEAEMASRAKDEFLGLLSHELRTPLNAILGWTRMLSTSQLAPQTTANALETIDRNAKLQSRLIEDMLDVSRIMSGKLRLDAQPTDLTTAINAAVDTLRPAAEAKNIRIYVVLDFGSGTVLGDPLRLQQMVWNLLSNAIKFTPKGGSVRVSLERVNSHFEINVSDSGPGIDKDFLPYVFERFRQGDSSTTKKHGGLGLGLAIVRQLTELHGGSVEAGNLEEGGAIFTISLPVMVARQQHQQSPGQVRPAVEMPTLSSDFDCPQDLEGIRVLAVDDDADSRLLLETILVECGAIVKTCETSAECLSCLGEFKPDVLVSDIGMPDEDGYTLIKKVRAAEKKGERVPAVALTAFARTEDRMKALSAGFNMHVPKPVEPAELMTVIASLVNHK